jgi:microcystin-dependent protein
MGIAPAPFPLSYAVRATFESAPEAGRRGRIGRGCSMEAYLGTIQAFAFDYAPQGWANCKGQVLSKDQYSALHDLLGTTWGGVAGVSTGLPDLRGRSIISQGRLAGGEYPVGASGGKETVTLDQMTMPAHSHGIVVSKADATTAAPGGDSVLAETNGLGPIGDPLTIHVYGPATDLTPLSPSAIGRTGALPDTLKSFSVVQPFLTVNFCINVLGATPPRPL